MDRKFYKSIFMEKRINKLKFSKKLYVIAKKY